MNASQDNERLYADGITWAVLLGRWIDFARSGVALGDDADSQRMKDSIADVIMLQAVYFALQHLGDLSSDEKALGLDRAEILITRHVDILHKRYAGNDMPEKMKDLIEDAWRQLKANGQS